MYKLSHEYLKVVYHLTVFHSIQDSQFDFCACSRAEAYHNGIIASLLRSLLCASFANSKDLWGAPLPSANGQRRQQTPSSAPSKRDICQSIPATCWGFVILIFVIHYSLCIGNILVSKQLFDFLLFYLLIYIVIVVDY